MGENSRHSATDRRGTAVPGESAAARALSELSPKQRALLELRLSKNMATGRSSTTIPAAGDAPSYPLSYAQRRLWFLDHFEAADGLYNVYRAWRVEGFLDIDRLQAAVQSLVDRHAVLRTSYTLENNVPAQRISDHAQVEVAITDLGDQQTKSIDSSLRDQVRDEVIQRFDLKSAAAIRVRVLRISDSDHVMVFTLPHIACDGWTMEILLRDLAALYQQSHGGQTAELPKLPVRYVDFASWERQSMHDGRLNGQMEYWRSQLAHVPILELSGDRPRPAAPSYLGDTVEVLIPTALGKRLRKLSQSHGATLFMTLLTAFKVLLYRYSGCTDIAVGSPVAGRNLDELENVAGVFVNTLVLRSDLSGEPGFDTLLGQVRHTCLDAFTNQDLPFERLVQELQPERDLSLNPLFQVMFVLHNQPMTKLRSANLALTPIDIRTGTSKFDLTLSLADDGGPLKGSLEFNADLFDSDTVDRIGKHFIRLLESVCDDPHTNIATAPLLAEDERNTIVHEWNRTDVPLPDRPLVHLLFEQRVPSNPDAVAIRDGELKLSYSELNCRANQLAHYFVSRGCGPDMVVGICLNRSADLIIAILGVLKSGAAYLPIDPSHPWKRIEFILGDADPVLLLTDSAFAGKVPSAGHKVVHIDTVRHEIEQHPATDPDRVLEPESLAYVLYTSGSTGQPKGAMISHRGLVNYCSWAAREYRADEGSGTLLHSSLAFDLTITSLFPPLLSGNTVTVVSEEGGVEALSEVLKQSSGLSLIKITPAHLDLITHRLPASEAAGKTAALVIGGDALFGEHLEFWRKYAPGTRLINEYGPTEATVGCCVHEVTPDNFSHDAVPIGHPIANTQLYVLDGHMQPVPIGVIGELYIGGAGVAKGYLNRPDLSAEKFLPDPFSSRTGGRIYKTGDLARYRADGTLEFHGRIDHQIKLRGHRIEPQEIEATLVTHPGVRDACLSVESVRDDDLELVAWLVPETGAAPSIRQLREFLQQQLPSYMIPARFALIEELPLNPHGKIDRRALPRQLVAASSDDHASTEPLDSVQSALINIWKQVLDLSKVSIDDGFFDLGGHSLLGTRLLVEIEQRFGVHLPLAVLFRTSTIRGLAEVIRKGGWGTEWNSLVTIQGQGGRPAFFSIHGDPSRLAPHLAADQPYYWLHRGQDGSLLRHASVEEVARDHLKEIVAIQPHGPYYIGGYSFGGLLALDVARQLQERGEEVALLVLFDPPAPPLPAGALPPRPLRETLSEALGYLPMILLWPAHWLRRSVRRAYQRIREHVLIAQDKPLPNRLRFARHGRIYLRAAKQYRYGNYDGHTLLFSPQLELRDLQRLTARWRSVVGDHLEVHMVSDAPLHGDLFQEPSVRYLAEHLTQNLGTAPEQQDHDEPTPSEARKDPSPADASLQALRPVPRRAANPG